MDEEIGDFALSKIFPLIFWAAILYFIFSIIYILYYFFIRKNYRYIEDHSKEEECLVCTEANCSKKQNKCNIKDDFFSPGTLFNEKMKIKSNLEIIEDHLNNLRPNDIDVNDSTLNEENEYKLYLSNTTKGTSKSSKSYMSNMSNSTYVNNDEEKQHHYNVLVGKADDNKSSQNYQYGCYGSTKVYGGKVKSYKVLENDKIPNGYKSINKKNTKTYQNYVSFSNVFKERSICPCECHNKEYNRIRVKYNTLDFVSKNNHEFIYWSFYVCLQISALMIILYGIFSVFPD
ncbi:hypothetical protein BCR36DRAFT_408492 [Piromyces finnis]|uniref:Uncharacterized protein n=1 Tax=Piromyces finnis TaxID=1754191 RepID=A0A1Y1VP34_9FUNG|nr:hypothetical protein BCR36DRAFT_408492 [Piromyces finnis]|eukprot:ORX60130.1 hypothetical protein BCR36DRAFT_408492 [Piromyces finnis]